jgi:hypothetical protein
MYFSIVLHALQVALLLTILVYVLRLSNRKETFANCFGAQYNGLPFLENKNAPICPHTYTSPYREGGCVQYDPQKISVEYASTPRKNNWISFV